MRQVPGAQSGGAALSLALVIFGATGDLAMRMLYPSLWFLHRDGLLPPGFRAIGVARSALAPDAFEATVRNAVTERGGEPDEAGWAAFAPALSYVAADMNTPDGGAAVAEALQGCDDAVFYLSTSPALYAGICRALAEQGLNAAPARVVVEKPLGRDLESCTAINDALAAAFSEDRIFRIDHYLGKETVQNLLALRFANTLFEPLWTKNTVEQVQITVAETVGVEGRWSYYDDYGALRDMVQNHLLQLLSLIAMEPPANVDPDSVRDEKVKVLRALRPVSNADFERRVVRGQYGRGVAGSEAAPAYAEESGGAASATETFVALAAYVDTWRWAGVPFYLRTGKRMPERRSRIVVQFRPVPHSIFPNAELTPNKLVIDLQPDESVSLLLMNKKPTLSGPGMELQPLTLNLSLATAFPGEVRRRIAYERLLLEAIRGDQTLFVRRDETEAAWRWIDGIEAGWRARGGTPAMYPAGSWGPAGAFALTERNGHSWLE